MATKRKIHPNNVKTSASAIRAAQGNLAIDGGSEVEKPMSDAKTDKVRAEARALAERFLDDEQFAEWFNTSLAEIEIELTEKLNAQRAKDEARLARVQSLTGKTSATPAPRAVKAPKAPRAPRASSGDSSKVQDSILALVSKSKAGIGKKMILASVEASAGQYNAAMKALMEGKKIKREGEKRATLYFPR